MHELVKDKNKYLGEAKVIIETFLKNLWERPDLITKILINSNIKDIKETLVSLFFNFYQNILSPYTVEDNFLYIVSVLLKDEILYDKKN